MSPEARGGIRFAAGSEPPEGVWTTVVPVLVPHTALGRGHVVDPARCERRGFRAKVGESLLLDGPGSDLEMLVGLGEPARIDREAFRAAGAAAARAGSGLRRLVVDLRGLEAHLGGDAPVRPDGADGADGAGTSGLGVAAAVAAFVEGAGLASYRFDAYRSTSPKGEGERLEEMFVVCDESGAAERGAERGAVLVEAVSLARDLVNTPAGDMTPVRFAAIAEETGLREGFSVEVLDEVAIAAERMGGLLGVARGSAEPPRFLKLVYEPEVELPSGAAAPTVALVGKGITFDSGGLSLKSAGGMMAMKTDMGGAAAVLATLSACRRLGVAIRVLGFAPLTENMPGGRATKPGDVLRTRNGKTIEVLNTDAEGRLVLADALAVAAEAAPDAIVDLATLTGACVVALGATVAGLMSNDDRLVRAVRSASARAGEATWPLPLPVAYRSQIDSEVADMKNIGAEGKAGALTAGLLLEEFVGEVPWAHLDIAGPARSEEDRGCLRKGGTGFGVRTLLELLQVYAPLGGKAVGAAGA